MVTSELLDKRGIVGNRKNTVGNCMAMILTPCSDFFTGFLSLSRFLSLSLSFFLCTDGMVSRACICVIENFVTHEAAADAVAEVLVVQVIEAPPGPRV